MDLGNYIYMLINSCMYTAIQAVVVCKFIGLDRNQKSCLRFIIIYSLILCSIEFLIYAPDLSAVGETGYWLHQLLHALNTFIILILIAFYSNEYFPRNFLIVSIYYDLLSILGSLIFQNTILKILISAGLTNQCVNLTDAHTLADGWLLFEYFFDFGFSMGIGFLLGDKIKKLVSKVPAKICTLYFIVSFVGYIMGLGTYSRYYFEKMNEGGQTWQLFVSMNSSFIVFGAMFICGIILYSLTNLRSRLLMDLENRMHYEYYQNIATIHSSVRQLRHDISNHLSAAQYAKAIDDASYRSTLNELTGRIRAELDSQNMWQRIETVNISNRGRYEVYKYIQSVSGSYNVDMKDVNFECSQTDKDEIITAVIPLDRKPVFIRKGVGLYQLVKEGVRGRGGTVRWSRADKGLVFEMRFPLVTSGLGKEAEHD